MQQYCDCMDVRRPVAGLKDIWAETIEVVEVVLKKDERSWHNFKDEFSDIWFGFGRLIAGLFGKVYVRVPGDRMHVNKINGRMAKRGCIRSVRAINEGDAICGICTCANRWCSGECNG